MKKKIFTKKFPKSEIEIKKLALGNQQISIKMKEFDESSSSTIKNIDEKSEYYKKKFRFLNLFKKKPLKR